MTEQPMQCERCGAPHAGCRGHKRDGSPCGNLPMHGQQVCRMHGGATPKAKAAAARRQQEAAAAELLSSMIWNPTAEPITDSVGEMQRLAGSMRQAADILGARLGAGEPCSECGRSGEPLDSVAGTAWLRVLRELRQLLEGMERLGIAGRAVELSEAQAAVMFAIHQRQLELLNRELPGGLPVPIRDLLIEAVLAGIGRPLELEPGGAA